MVLYGVLGEYFRGNAANSLTLGEFFRGRKLEGLVWVAGGQSPVGQVLWSGVIVLCPSGWVMR